MTRLSKQARKRNQSPRKHRAPFAKTGPKKDNLPQGYKEHFNALGDQQTAVFISRIK
jgi:hypothetical protein